MDQQLNQTKSKIPSDQQPDFQSISVKKPYLPLWVIVLITIVAVIVIAIVSYGAYRYFVLQSQPCVDKCGDGICQGVVCQGETCPCLETVESCPEDCQEITTEIPKFTAEEVKYQLIYKLANINGKLAYVAREGDKNFVVYNDAKGKKYPITEYYGEQPSIILDSLTEISGRLTYEVATGQVIEFFVHGNQEIEGDSPTEVNGKLAYVKSKEGGDYVVYEGKEFGPGGYPIEINGKLAYTMFDQPGIVYDGKIYGAGIARKGPAVEVYGKLTYVAKKENKEFVVYGEKEGKKYELIPDLTPGNYRVYSPTEVVGKLAYMVKYGNQTCVVYDEQEQKKYDNVSSLTGVNGKLAYIASEDGEYFVVYDGNEGERYHRIYNLGEVNGKLTYIALESDEFFVHGSMSGRSNYGGDFIIYGDQKIGEEYDEVLSPIELNGKLVFTARKGSVWYIVSEF